MMLLEKLVKQKRLPVYTVTSILVTVLVEFEMMSGSRPARDSRYPVPEMVGNLMFKLLAVFFGFIVNIVAGRVAHKRGEFWGGRIAAVGIAVWLVTLATLSPFSR
jgi:hypothetical protein